MGRFKDLFGSELADGRVEDFWAAVPEKAGEFIALIIFDDGVTFKPIIVTDVGDDGNFVGSLWGGDDAKESAKGNGFGGRRGGGFEKGGHT